MILAHMLYGIILIIYNSVLNIYMLCYAECLFTLQKFLQIQITTYFTGLVELFDSFFFQYNTV